jgi:uncharacterized surface protein with fasciclin (FAS1) repeats
MFNRDLAVPKNLLSLAALLLTLITMPLTALADDDDYDDDYEMTITEIVLESGGEFDKNKRDFDILLNAVVTAGLADALDNPEDELTVLAPDDKAFIKLARDLGYDGHDEAGTFDFLVTVLTDLGGGDPIPVLTDILLYHVSPEEQDLEDLLEHPEIETLLGAFIYQYRGTLIDAEPELANPKVKKSKSDIEASNGYIHIISRVLIPVDLDNTPDDAGTIADIVAASGGEFDDNSKDYDLLLNAVIAADLVDALADESISWTVFAPNDMAFVRLARALGYEAFDEEGAFLFLVDALTDLGGGDPIPPLTDVLLYHVSPDLLTLNQVVFSDEVTTLLMDATFSPDGLKLMDEDPGIRDPKIDVGSSDIRASNGLIHTINRVLLPLQVSSP